MLPALTYCLSNLSGNFVGSQQLNKEEFGSISGTIVEIF